VRRSKKRGAGCVATNPKINSLTGPNSYSLNELLQAYLIEQESIHSCVKSWNKPNWLTEEFEEYVSKTHHSRKRGMEK